MRAGAVQGPLGRGPDDACASDVSHMDDCRNPLLRCIPCFLNDSCSTQPLRRRAWLSLRMETPPSLSFGRGHRPLCQNILTQCHTATSLPTSDAGLRCRPLMRPLMQTSDVCLVFKPIFRMKDTVNIPLCSCSTSILSPAEAYLVYYRSPGTFRWLFRSFSDDLDRCVLEPATTWIRLVDGEECSSWAT